MMCHKVFKRSTALNRNGVLPGLGAVGCAVLVLGLFGAGAHGAYILSPMSGGQDTVTVERGEPFTLDLVLTSDVSSDEVDTIELAVVFSQPGLQLDSVTWHGQFAAAGSNTNNDPSNLPTIVVDDSRGDPGSDIDVRLEAFNMSAPFTTGPLVSLGLTIPSGFGPDTVVVDVNPLGAMNDDAPVTITVGSSLTLNVVPEPGSVLLLGIGCVLLGYRRRSH